jgi:hypothetical protein
VPHSLPAHDRDRCLGNNDDAEEIGFDLGTEIGKAGILNRADISIARIVNEDIQSSKGIRGCLYGPLCRSLISNVEGDGANSITVALRQIRELCRIARRGDELVTGAKNGVGECSAQSTGAAGYQPNL